VPFFFLIDRECSLFAWCRIVISSPLSRSCPFLSPLARDPWKPSTFLPRAPFLFQVYGTPVPLPSLLKVQHARLLSSYRPLVPVVVEDVMKAWHVSVFLLRVSYLLHERCFLIEILLFPLTPVFLFSVTGLVFKSRHGCLSVPLFFLIVRRSGLFIGILRFGALSLFFVLSPHVILFDRPRRCPLFTFFFVSFLPCLRFRAPLLSIRCGRDRRWPDVRSFL